MGAMRVQRALARAGIASRRKAEELIAAGRVTVNAKVAQLGQVVDPDVDSIAVDGSNVTAAGVPEWLVLNKPAGVMTTRRDPDGRRTVFDLVPQIAGLTYVGRLDYLTEGLLLLTTDGVAAHVLSHPSSEVARTYVATVNGKGDQAADAARRGVDLPDGPVKPERVAARRLGRDRWELELTLREGRKREVRRLCTDLGLGVERLVRTHFGPVALGDLRTGATRKLTTAEHSAIERLVAGKRKAGPNSEPSQR